MPNFDFRVDETIFASDAPQRARDYLPRLFGRLDPNWLENPVGPLARLWRAPGCELELIDLARVLDTVGRNITKRSVPEFARKVRELLRFKSKKSRDLLRPKSETSYIEAMAELQFIAVLSERASPIALAPLVPTDDFASPRRLKSPDLGIRLPDGDVTIEVTVLYVQALTFWRESADHLFDALLHGVRKAGVARSVNLRIDLGFNYRKIPDRQIREMVRQVVERPQGTINLTAKDGLGAEIAWRLVPILPSPKSEQEIPAALGQLPQDWTVAILGNATGALHGSLDVRRDEFVEEPIYRSLCNTLKTKRKQCGHQGPFLVVVQPGDTKLKAEWIEELLERRIWPDRDYKKITAVLIQIPRVSFDKASPGHKVIVSLNRNATNPATGALLEMLEGKKKFLP